jgi:hypothetical protein
MNHYLTLMRLWEHLHQIVGFTLSNEDKAHLIRELRAQVPAAMLLPTAQKTHQLLLSAIDAALTRYSSATDRTDSPGEAPKAKAPRKKARSA